MIREATLNWDYLVNNLREQSSLYSKLNKLLFRENQIIIKNNISELSAITPEKDSLNYKINDAKKNFNMIISKIVVGQSQDVNIRQLIDVAPTEYKKELKTLHQQLTDLAIEIKKHIYKNQKLVESSVKYISHMMKKMIEISSESAQQVYCNRGYTRTLGGQQNFMNIVA
ncbi:MAG: hypothetical protein A2Y40_07050 [Candidatus Margulisbacteria bacterium GWF2_35_9]|nr:MAG: hypothetical protein A2Y40_07050 [Candidatus Margulisbacteria bacterium GWF2_35_9]